MIDESAIRPIGCLLKPHGICGDVTAVLTEDVDLGELSCVMLKLDGICVPFFLNGVRPKSKESYIVTIDGIKNECEAARLCPSEIYALASEIPGDDDADSDALYATDMIGFEVFADDELLGKIVGVDDTTANYLFIIERTDGSRCLIPVADEFITGVDATAKSVDMSLPNGLTEL